jgi:hypothetical protein
MQVTQTSSGPTRYRPSSVSVFAAAFVAGAVVAFGLNRMLDVHLAQSRPQVESVPIFVALRSLPQGAPVTVWDVALRDWPKAMLPTTALMAQDSFAGMILKHPLREGQPLLSVQLMRVEPQAAAEPPGADEVFAVPTPANRQVHQPSTDAGADLGTPVPTPAQVATPADVPPSTTQPAVAQPVTEPADSDQVMAQQGEAEQLPTVSISAAPTEDAVPMEANDPAAATSPEVTAEPERVAVVTDEVTEAVIEDRPTEPTLADIAPPVPASPAIDIERPLKAMSSQRFANRSPAFTDTPYSGAAVAESVLTDTPSASPAPSLPSASDSAPQPMRYLVVPERIAIEADASFAPPPVAEPDLAPPSRGTAPSTRPQPQKQPQTQTQNQRQGQGQPQSASAPSQAPRQRGAMFPNMAAGLEALGAPLRASQATPPKQAR